MAYEKTIWEPREGSNLDRFDKANETDRSVILRNRPSLITKPGTKFSTQNMNKIENGIYDAHELIATYEKEINKAFELIAGTETLIDFILELVPEQASNLNQLADKAFVKSSLPQYGIPFVNQVISYAGNISILYAAFPGTTWQTVPGTENLSGSTVGISKQFPIISGSNLYTAPLTRADNGISAGNVVFFSGCGDGGVPIDASDFSFYFDWEIRSSIRGVIASGRFIQYYEGYGEFLLPSITIQNNEDIELAVTTNSKIIYMTGSWLKNIPATVIRRARRLL